MKGKIGPTAKKKIKDFRNRSSEFSKNEFMNDLNMVKTDSGVIHRNSNELWGYKQNMLKDSRVNNPDNRRMYASGYRFSNTG